jgi:HSP20 family protein
VFTLSDAIDDNKIKASYENGVLTLSLPKAEWHKTRKIEVAAS